MAENQIIEYKSLKKVSGKNKDYRDLAKTCVAMANNKGGSLMIGIEDGERKPPKKQKISDELTNEILRELTRLTNNLLNPSCRKITDRNGGEYITIDIKPSQGIALTTDGKVYIRTGDESRPANPEDLYALGIDKGLYQWELGQNQRIELQDANQEQVERFINEIKNSKNTSLNIKNKTKEEILEHYRLIENGLLTNLGVLWIGQVSQRARLTYPLSATYITYDQLERKNRKVEWNTLEFNPKELLIAIENEVVEFKYTTEIPQGLFRNQVPHYHPDVVRELLVNAIAHRSFAIGNPIEIKVYPDRITITNPGSLPPGVTKDNILHTMNRRNPFLVNTLEAVGLMESEGTGYDLIYEKLSKDAKEYPEIDDSYNSISITLKANIIDDDVVRILDFATHSFSLTQKEIITLGIIARKRRISSVDLSNVLQLKSHERLRDWIGTLAEKGLIYSSGNTKGTEYCLQSDRFIEEGIYIKSRLTVLTEAQIKLLILEILGKHSSLSSTEIYSHFNNGAIKKEILKVLFQMVESDELITSGAKKGKRYSIKRCNS